MESIKGIINSALSMGLMGYAIITVVIIAIMILLRKLFPAVLATYINIAIVVATVYLAFKNMHWLLALKALGIFFLGFIIVQIISALSSEKGKKGTKTAIIQYMGKDAHGNDLLDMKIRRGDPPQTSPGPGSNSGKTTWVQYVGKDENGNDKFKWG
jgi:hypothetical protein